MSSRKTDYIRNLISDFLQKDQEPSGGMTQVGPHVNLQTARPVTIISKFEPNISWARQQCIQIYR